MYHFKIVSINEDRSRKKHTNYICSGKVNFSWLKWLLSSTDIIILSKLADVNCWSWLTF